MLTKFALVALGSGAAAATAVSVTLVASSSPAPPAAGPAAEISSAKDEVKDKNPQPPGKQLILTGVISGRVAPGLPRVLTVTVRNPNSQPVLLKSVTGTVTRVDSGDNTQLEPCDPTWFSIGSFNGNETIERDASTSVQLPVTLADLSSTNQDNCKNANYDFSFNASATSK